MRDRWPDDIVQPAIDPGRHTSRVRRPPAITGLDWILLRGHLTARSAIIDYRTDEGLLPSDHYPVVARIEYARQMS